MRENAIFSNFLHIELFTFQFIIPGWPTHELDGWNKIPIKTVVSRENSFLSLTASGDISSVFLFSLNVPRKTYNSLRKIENLFIFCWPQAKILHNAQKKGIHRNCLSSISGVHKMANRIYERRKNFIKGKDEHEKMSKDNYNILEFPRSAPIDHLLDDTEQTKKMVKSRRHDNFVPEQIRKHSNSHSHCAIIYITLILNMPTSAGKSVQALPFLLTIEKWWNIFAPMVCMFTMLFTMEQILKHTTV